MLIVTHFTMEMKMNKGYNCRHWLVHIVLVLFFGCCLSCSHENDFDQKVAVKIQIPLPEQNDLKSASSITRIINVSLTVAAGNKILDQQDLDIVQNTAVGTVTITKGKNIKFSAEATDENNIVQWQGSTTKDILQDNFSVDIDMISIPPKAVTLEGFAEGRVVFLNWTQNSDDDFALYAVYRSVSENTLGTLLYSTPLVKELIYEDLKVSPNTIYYYTLVVFDTEGFSTESNVIEADVLISPKPSVLTGSYIGGANLLSWTKNTDTDFDRYELYRSFSGSVLGTRMFTTSNVSQLDFTDQQISESTTYYYTLVTYDTEKLNAKSNVVRVVTPVF